MEATSGNTGIAFAAIGRALGHPVEVFMPDWMSAERVALLRALGAGVHLVSRAEGGFLGSIEQAEVYAAARPGRVPAPAVLEPRERGRPRGDDRAGDLAPDARRWAWRPTPSSPAWAREGR